MVKGTRAGGLMYGEVTNGNMGNGHRQTRLKTLTSHKFVGRR